MKVLKKLKIKNFLVTKSREVDFDMHDDLLLITWKNAGGKTTIMRAVYFALTGEDAFFGAKNLDNVINDYAESMEINLILSINNNIYDITVDKKRGKAININILKNNESLLKGALNKDAKNKLTELFWNPTSISSTYFIFGDDKNEFVSTTPSERLKVITKVSDKFKTYDEISLRAKWFVKWLEETKNKELWKQEYAQNNINELKDKVENFNLEDNKKELEKLEKNNKSLKDEKEILIKIEEINNTLKLSENVNVEELVNKLDTDNKNKEHNNKVNEKISKEKDNINTEQNKLNEINLEVSKKESEIKNINNEVNTNKSFIQKVNNEVIEKHKGKWDINERINKWKEFLEKIKNEWTDLRSKLNILSNSIQEKKELLSDKNNSLKDTDKLFKENNHCPLCHSELTEKALKGYTEYIQKDINNINSDIEKLNKDKLKTEEDILSKTNDYKKYNVLLDELLLVKTELEKDNKNKEIEKKVNELNNKLVNEEKLLKDLVSKQNKQTEILLKQKELLSTIEKDKKELLSNSEVENINKILEANKDSKKLDDEKNKLVKKLSKSDVSINDVNMNINENQKTLDELNNKIVTYNVNKEKLEKEEKQLEEVNKTLKRINFDINQYNDIFKLFWKDGVQKNQIQMLLWQIEMETNGLIRKFFENISVKFSYDKKGIDLKIIRRITLNNGAIEEKEDVLNNFSDAQKETLEILLKLSFSKVVQSLNNTPLNVLFLNESFNTLSKDKSNLLIETLDYYRKNYHIVFITHDTDIIWNFWEWNVYKIWE